MACLGPRATIDADKFWWVILTRTCALSDLVHSLTWWKHSLSHKLHFVNQTIQKTNFSSRIQWVSWWWFIQFKVESFFFEQQSSDSRSLCWIKFTVSQNDINNTATTRERKKPSTNYVNFISFSPVSHCYQTASGKELIFIFWFIGHWLHECSGLIDVCLRARTSPNDLSVVSLPS